MFRNFSFQEQRGQNNEVILHNQQAHIGSINQNQSCRQLNSVYETGRAGPALTSLGPACGLYIKPGRGPLGRALQEKRLVGPEALAGRVIGCYSRLLVAHTLKLS